MVVLRNDLNLGYRVGLTRRCNMMLSIDKLLRFVMGELWEIFCACIYKLIRYKEQSIIQSNQFRQVALHIESVVEFF